SIAHGREPSAPAFDAAMASALPCTPAIGAWMIGSSVPSRSESVMSRGSMGYTNHGTLGDFMNITMRHTRFATLTMSLGLLVGGLSTVSVTACTSATRQRG